MTDETPPEDRVLGYSPTGQAITPRTMREQVERQQLAGEEARTSLRRMLYEELSTDQLTILSWLFGALTTQTNPLALANWYEGQIDMALWMRQREKSFADIPAELLQEHQDQPEVETAVVEGTLDRHDFVTDESPGVPLCTFSTQLPTGQYRCALPRDSAPHRR